MNTQLSCSVASRSSIRLNRHVSQFRKIKCNLFNRKIDVYVFHVVTDTVKKLMCGRSMRAHTSREGCLLLSPMTLTALTVEMINLSFRESPGGVGFHTTMGERDEKKLWMENLLRLKINEPEIRGLCFINFSIFHSPCFWCFSLLIFSEISEMAALRFGSSSERNPTDEMSSEKWFFIIGFVFSSKPTHSVWKPALILISQVPH